MRRRRGVRKISTAIAALLLGLLPTAVAAFDVNEIGALLVFPVILNEADPGPEPSVETFVTITNAGPFAVGLRLLFIDGTTCSSCVLSGLEVGANDADRLVFTRDGETGETVIRELNGGVGTACPGANGFAVAALYDLDTGLSTYSNVILGDATVVDYGDGSSYSVTAVTVRGSTGDSDFEYEFDGNEYQRFPEELQGDFIAPDATEDYDAHVGLFSLGFTAGILPTVNCTVAGIDADGELFDSSFQFGCWTHRALENIDSRFAYPALGGVGNHEHGWLRLNCTVDGAIGGVHGSITQKVAAGSALLHADPTSPLLAAPVRWGRLLHQSRSEGDPVSFLLEVCNGADDDGDLGIDEGCDDDNDGYCDENLIVVGNPPVCPAGTGDCDDDLVSVFAVPAEIQNLRWPDGSNLAWDSDASNSGVGTGYDVMYGDLTELSTIGSGALEQCLAGDHDDTEIADASPGPSAGSGWYFLVRGANNCGDGSYGVSSFGSVRATATCSPAP